MAHMIFAFTRGKYTSGKGGEYALSAIHNSHVFGAPDAEGRASVVSSKSVGRMFSDDRAMLAFASRECNGGKPVSIVEPIPGVGYVVASEEAPKAPAKKG